MREIICVPVNAGRARCQPLPRSTVEKRQCPQARIGMLFVAHGQLLSKEDWRLSAFMFLRRNVWCLFSYFKYAGRREVLQKA